MFQRTLPRTLAGLFAVGILVLVSVLMVRDPGCFGEEARFERLFRERPLEFAACGNRLEYVYEARVGEGAGGREVHTRYEQLPVAAGGGRIVYRFRPIGRAGAALFAAYDRTGKLLRLYRDGALSVSPSEDLAAISVAFGKAMVLEGVGRIAEFPFDEPMADGAHFRGRSLLTASVRRKPDEVVSCVEAREEDAVKASHRLALPEGPASS